MALNLDELERLHREATPGPWKHCGCGKCGLVWSLPIDCTVGDSSGKGDREQQERVGGPLLPAEQQSKNAELVAALYNALPQLLTLARRAQSLDAEPTDDELEAAGFAICATEDEWLGRSPRGARFGAASERRWFKALAHAALTAWRRK